MVLGLWSKRARNGLGVGNFEGPYGTTLQHEPSDTPSPKKYTNLDASGRATAKDRRLKAT